MKLNLFNTFDTTAFLKDLETTVIQENSSNYIPSIQYKPSKLVCTRQMYYYRTKTKPEQAVRKASWIEIPQTGEDRHIRLQNYVMSMKKHGFDYEYVSVSDFLAKFPNPDLEIKPNRKVDSPETKLYNRRYDMTFMADGILLHSNVYRVIEFKTEGSKKWNSRMGVDLEHYNQATCYCLSFNLDEVIFVYENRDTLEKKVYLLKVTSEMKEKVKKKMFDCNSYVDKNILPPKEECAQCTFCEYKSKCILNVLGG